MTRIFLSFAVLLVLTATLSSCLKVVGSGPTVSENRTLTNFSSISLAMDATVNITQDSFFKVEILAQQNIMKEIQTNVSNSRLTIKHRNNMLIKSSPVIIHITMPYINGLNVSGSGKVQLQNEMLTGNLEMNVSGSGDIAIPVLEASIVSSTISGSGKIAVGSGKAASLDSKISGSGDLDMLNVSANTVNTSTSGSGTTRVFAVQSLFAKISGSGDVHYRGNPSVESEISGSGRLIKE